MSKYAQLKLKLKEMKQNEPLKVEVCVNYKDTYKNEINDLNLTHLKTVNMNDLSLDTIVTTLIKHRFFYDNARPYEFSIEAINHPEYGIVLAVIFDIYNMVDYFIRPLNQNELREQQPTVKESCQLEEPQTIREETQEPTKKAQTKKVVEVIKNQLSNIKEVTTKNEHYYKIHLNNNYMITAFYSNCAKCYKVTLFDMSKSPKNGENKVVHTLKLQDLTNFKEVYNFCQIVEKQIQEQPTTKESCKTVESTTTTIKEETQEQPTFEELVKKINKERKRGMEFIYNIVVNNFKDFTHEDKSTTITRHFKPHDNETCFNGNYNYMFTYSYEWYAKKWVFTLVNDDCVIVLNRGIHKSLLNEKWLLDLCKQVNDIINESK